MNPQKKTFLQETVPEKLKALSPDTAPLWGLMTAQHMVEHLSGAMVMSLGKFRLGLQATEAELPRRLAWLHSGKPFRKSVPAPGDKPGELKPLRFGSMEEAVGVLQQSINQFYQHFQEADAVAMHPYFGDLGGAAWEHFHFKHIYHHLSQFGLLPEVTAHEAMSL